MGSANRGLALLLALWLQVGLATLFVAARFWARIMIDPNLGWDDWTMLIALSLDYSALIVLSYAVHYGLGSHQNTLSPANASHALELQWIFQPLQVAATIIARVSITILLIRLFPTKKSMKWFLIVLTVLNVTVGIPGLALIFTQCTPSRKLWDHTVAGGYCIDPNIQKSIALLKASLSAFSDLATAIWPFAIISTLQMKPQLKAFLGTLFALTLVAMVTAIVQACYISLNTVRIDQTYRSALVAIWVSTGVNTVIIVGTIPTLRPLQKKWFSSSGSSNKKFRRFNGDAEVNSHSFLRQDTSMNLVSVVAATTTERNNDYISDPMPESYPGKHIRATTEIDVLVQ